MSTSTPTPAWSPKENELIVAAYFGMLALRQCGQKVNKSAVRRQLIIDMRSFSGRDHGRDYWRSEPSVEFKMRNISGVLDDANSNWLQGYAPLPNYQRSLLVAVAKHGAAPSNVLELLTAEEVKSLQS